MFYKKSARRVDGRSRITAFGGHGRFHLAIITAITLFVALGFIAPIFAATTIIQQQFDTSQTAARTFEYSQEFFPETAAHATTIGLPYGGFGSDGFDCFVKLYQKSPGGDVLLDTATRTVCSNTSIPSSPFNLLTFPKMPILYTGTEYKWVYNTGRSGINPYWGDNSTVVYGSQNALSGGGVCSGGLPSCAFTLFEDSTLLHVISFDTSSGTALNQDGGNHVGVNVVSIDSTVNISLFIADPGVNPISHGTLWTSGTHMPNPNSPLYTLFTLSSPPVIPNRFYALEAALTDDAGNILATSTVQDFFVAAKTPLVSSTSTVIIQQELETSYFGSRSFEYSQEFYPANTAYATTIGLPFGGNGSDGANCFVNLYEVSPSGDVLLDTATRQYCQNTSIPPFNLFMFSKAPLFKTGTKYKWVYNTGSPTFRNGENSTVVYGSALLNGGATCSAGGFSMCAFTLFQDPVLLPQQQKEPVIIVPGIMGSRLNRVSDGSEVWPDITDMKNPGSDSYLDALITSVSGQQILGNEMYSSDIIREATGTFLGLPIPPQIVYSSLIEYFISVGYNEGQDLFVVPYDWRFNTTDNVGVLSAIIQKARAHSPDGKISLIGHSMGTLLIKDYLATTASTDFVDRVVFLGSPNLGSPKDFKLLNYGDNLGLVNWLGLGLNANEAQKISQNMPGAYELLPSREYIAQNKIINQNIFNATGAYVVDHRGNLITNQPLDYDATQSFMVNAGRNAGLLSGADSYHQSRDSMPLHIGSSTQFYNIVGCRVPTLGRFDFYNENAIAFPNGYQVGFVDGDGTVPTISVDSYPNATQTYYAYGIDHQGLITNTSATIPLIQNLISGNTTATVAGIEQDKSLCGNPFSYTLFATHSPVTLGIYNSVNQFTGPDQYGNITTGIPGSDYESIDGNSFILTPASDTYRVAIQGTASGTFNFDITSLTGTMPTGKITYLNIPLASASTTATVTVAPLSAPLLRLDKDGDGLIDVSIAPTGILSASSSQDYNPPILTMPTIPNQVLQSSTLMLVFSASDTGSGVATSSATLNGVSVTSGQIVTFTKVGKNTFHFTAQDFAGNPSVQDLVFTVLGQLILSPSADTSVRRDAPNRNYGRESVLRITSDDKSHALAAFNHGQLRSVIGSSTIVSATLEFTVFRYGDNRNGKDGHDMDKRNDNNNGKGNDEHSNKDEGKSQIDLYRLTHDWTELDATWNCPNDANTANHKANCKSDPWNMGKSTVSSPNPWVTSSTASLLITNNTTGTIQFDVMKDIQSFVSSSTPNDGWILKKTDENTTGRIELGSRESSQGPKLKIVYSP